MRVAYYLTLLTAAFSLSLAVLQAQTAVPGISQPARPSTKSVRAGASASSTPSGANHSRDVLKQRAETASAKAALLREKQTSTDLNSAAGLFRESARLFEAASLHEDAADAHVHAGEIYFAFSQYDKARRSYREALKIGQHPEVRCRALSRMAQSYVPTGPFALADDYSKQAMSVCEHLNEKAQAEALEARGEVLDFAGESSESGDYLRRARDLFALAHDDAGQARTLYTLALLDLFSGDKRARGLVTAEEALRLSTSTGNRYEVARMRSLLGISAIRRGEFETAQCNYAVARPVFHGIGNKDDEAIVFNGLGYVSRETGDWQKSLEYYTHARSFFADVRDLRGEIEAIIGIGKAMTAMKNYHALLPLYQAELRLARQAGDPVQVAASLADIAGAVEAEKRYAEAETFYRGALEVHRGADDISGEGLTLTLLGRLQAKQGVYSQAIASLQQANALMERTGEVEQVAKIQYELAYIYRRLDRLEEARAAIEKTIEIIEKQRVTLSHFDSRASYFAAVHRYYALYIQILMLLHAKYPGLGFAELAFAASEKSKVRSLLDLLTTSSQDAPCDELLQRQLDAGAATELRTPVAEKKDLPVVAPTLTLKQVQAEIGNEDTALLEYALGDEKSYVWVVGPHQITSHERPKSAQIRQSVDAFRKALIPAQLRNGESAVDYQARVRNADQAYRLHAQQLSRLLLEPLPLSGLKRLLIVPDESLQYIPFAALLFPGSGAGKELLVEHFEIDALPSASVLGILRKATRKRAPPTAAAAIFADPVFEADDERVSTRRAGAKRSYEDRPASLTRAIRDVGGSQYIARLPASRDEAEAIAKVLRSPDPQAVHVALDFDASRANVLTDGLTRFRLVHFATHGVVDARHPEMSGLILSLVDRRGRRQDGYLRLGDIYKLKLSADLVVLSSCDSALGRDLESEGIIGLPRGFLYAGAKSVIASLWKVNDDATATLMSRLYARIKKGESPSSALRGAQLEMVQDERWANPYYWAAFVLQGDYR
jgi:CHAT domain-containing protein/tetratricopeptide (TPR) repeat protein